MFGEDAVVKKVKQKNLRQITDWRYW
jgi:hypothetical protein